MTRALMITNPAAARTADQGVSDVLGLLRQAGWEVDLIATLGTGDARRLAETAARDALDVVVVFGGDGTTMQAAAGLVGTTVSLGIIPGGTGNLLAGNLRIPASPARAAVALLSSQARMLDLGRIEREDGPHYFAVACGAGYDAKIMAGTSPENKRRWGMGAYVATTLRLLRDLRNVPHRITVDGVEFHTEGSMVLVANCAEVLPPYVSLRSGISPEDGLLDVVVFRADTFATSVRTVWELLRQSGSPMGTPGNVTYARGREVRVEAEIPQPVQLDGEPIGMTPFTATVVPGAVSVLAPRSP